MSYLWGLAIWSLGSFLTMTNHIMVGIKSSDFDVPYGNDLRIPLLSLHSYRILRQSDAYGFADL
jgi:hypothetical protein